MFIAPKLWSTKGMTPFFIFQIHGEASRCELGLSYDRRKECRSVHISNGGDSSHTTRLFGNGFKPTLNSFLLKFT